MKMKLKMKLRRNVGRNVRRNVRQHRAKGESCEEALKCSPDLSNHLVCYGQRPN